MMEVGEELTREKTRIYVGGLGGGVTEDDLRRTFSALGEVVSVDVVRTKGRSFAYLDFLPSSDKSLLKLFSTYNGCMWKGGKLRLEKAKEHYLLRLKREWQEDSEHASKASDSCNADPSESVGTLEKSKKPPSADKTNLNIFFPKLGKVKSLASAGIGKHKYSFQRLQVPSIPTHFCDCEEHSLAFVPTNKKQSSEFVNASDGINEQELNIMNSVMNRIFEKANPSKQANGKSESVNGNGVSMNSNDELAALENDEEDHLTDEDNLIINMATGRSDSMDLLGEMRTMMVNREPVANRLVTSGGKPKNVQDSREKKTKSVQDSREKKTKSVHDSQEKKTRSVHDSQEKKTMLLSKKRKSPHSVENHSSGSVISEALGNSQIHLDTREDSKTEIKSGTKQSGSNSLRSLKSTWKDLIGQQGNMPFSISSIIATVPQEKSEKLKGDDTPKKSLVSSKKRKRECDRIELVSSVPETRSSTSHINKEVVLDILANDPQQKEEPRADDLDMPLTKIADQFMISDVLSKEKEDEPTTDDIDVENIHDLENADNQSGKSKELTEALPAKHDEDLIRTARGDAWRHKSSWTQLISNTGHTSFNISQIVPNLSFEKQADAFDLQPANKNLDKCAAETANNQRPAGVVTMKKSSERRKSLSLGNTESEDSCLFMRTEASLKEWKKAKASLSSSLNKKKKPVKESA
ncbi:uncharacterized protein LOC112502791 [Cynara cardunculus var. scolymus]|uniref:RRM domain-containing protein n=1 Tax=Cynara cardunculus var. scolymus TaxID=59895 RepID=A0A103XC14_CYNCS|nr:uncharacterized protein LOC112502791 [Cynara cardunculus var. scolymus]KVH87950.1 hypothetical protein Ccrd_024702 [Cynara cardunculus var. scolymus]